MNDSETAGVDRREQIDTETVKGLLVINGGGSITMLAFLLAIIDKQDLAPLVYGALIALVTFPAGIVAALWHNILRRGCSLAYDVARWRQHPGPRPCRVLGMELRDPCVCLGSRAFRTLSILCFCSGCIVVAVQGFVVLASQR